MRCPWAVGLAPAEGDADPSRVRRLLLVLFTLIAAAMLTWLVSDEPPAHPTGSQPPRNLHAESVLAPLGDPRAEPHNLSRADPPRGEPARVQSGEASATQGAAGEMAEPTSALSVRVVDEAGRPVAGAHVRFEYGWVRAGRVMPVAMVPRTSDARGIAVLLEDPLGDEAWGVVCRANDGESRASAPLELVPPFSAGPHPLVLLPGGSVRVRLVVEPGGPPLEGAYVHLSPHGERAKSSTRMATTGVHGEATFGPLAPGRWDVYAAYSAAAEHPARAEIEVRAGEEALVELTLAAPGERFAVSGVFVDEEGCPLPGGGSLWIGENRVRGRLVHADGQGRFLLLREPCKSLLVELAQRADMDDFEPFSTVVPFGTRDLVFRRIAQKERRSARFRVVDNLTGEPIEQGSVCLHAGDAMQCLERNMGRRRGDVIEIRYAVRPGLLWTAWAPGYVRRSGLLDGGEEVCEVRLVPGIAGTLVVRDAASTDAIAGATIVGESGEILGRTGPDGSIHLEGAAAAGALTVTAEGYRPRTWYLSWPGELVWLERR